MKAPALDAGQLRLVIMIAMCLASVALISAIALAITRRRRDQASQERDLLSNAVTLMALAITAEGMFWVLTTKLAAPIPWQLAIFVCAVAEGLMVTFFRLARKFKAEHGRPGPFGIAFWIVAAGEGLIVALASTNPVEITMRILLPLAVALLHWLKLTADGSQEHRGRLVWTPLNLLIRIGAWKPGTVTIDEAEARRREDRMTRAAYTLADCRWFHARRARRVRRMMLDATPETATAVVERLRLAYGIEARIVEATSTGHAEVEAASPAIGAGTPVNGTPVNGETLSGILVPTRRQITPAMTTAQRDADIVTRHWESLTGLAEAGTLCRSSIERACTVGTDKVLARQANRIVEIMQIAISTDPSLPVEDRVNAAISELAARR